MNRRDLLKTGAALLAAPQAHAQPLPPWAEGTLDIHHISTGRGSCAFLICPDGTTIMLDAGAVIPVAEDRKFIIDGKPDASRRPGEWIARYVLRRMPAARRAEIDYFVLTHFHADHIGQYSADAPRSRYGNYSLTGIADVAEAIPVRRIIDRAYPEYRYPGPLNDAHQRNYRAFVSSFAAQGGRVEKIRVGSASQIRLIHGSESYPDFMVRNIAANGEVWTGAGETTRHHFPELRSLEPSQYPVENMCSLGLRISYGRFRYFAAGDMTFDTNYGMDEWRDIETPVAMAAGPVDVAAVNHHGYVDASGPEFVRLLRPRAWVINAWDSAHPAMPALHNMLSRELYPGERDIYATAIKPEALIALRRLAELKSDNGHVIFRVASGGDSFRVFITTNKDESDRVVGSFGPFQAG